MLGCAACGALAAGRICPSCRASLQPGPSFLTPGGVAVVAAFRHHGAARRLVHGIKYRAVAGAQGELAAAMAECVPGSTTALVPVRRAMLRRWRHGVDPAFELARDVARLTGISLADVLRPELWWPRHAGRGVRRRSPVRFRALRAGEPGWVLVDDVATTGATLDAAAHALGSRNALAIVATAPSRVEGTLVTTERSAGLADRGAGVSANDHSGQESVDMRTSSRSDRRRPLRRAGSTDPGR